MLSQRQKYFSFEVEFSSSEVLEISYFDTYHSNTFPLIIHSMIDVCRKTGQNQVIDLETWLIEVK